MPEGQMPATTEIECICNNVFLDDNRKIVRGEYATVPTALAELLCSQGQARLKRGRKAKADAD